MKLVPPPHIVVGAALQQGVRTQVSAPGTAPVVFATQRRRRRNAIKALRAQCAMPFEVAVLAQSFQSCCSNGIDLCVSRISARERTDTQVHLIRDIAKQLLTLEEW